MNKSTLILCCLVAAISLGNTRAQAQEKKTYTILSDDPMGFKKLFVNINLVEIDVASPTEARPGIGAEYTLNRNLYFFAEYNHTVFPLATEYTTKKSQSYAEAGTIFSFSSNIAERKARIRGKSGTDHYKWKVRARALKQFGVHGGLNSFSTYKKDNAYYAYSNTNSVFAGIAVTTTRDIVVDISDHGTYASRSRSIWYVDVMVAPSLTYSDATDYAAYAGSAGTASPLSFPKFTKSPIGARMGYMKYKNTRLPMREGFEFGMRPGIGSGLFFALRADISIGFMKGKTETSTDQK